MQVKANSRKAILVACTGYALSGKDCLADILVRDFGYVKIGWADNLYIMALKINPWIWTPVPVKLSFLVNRIGWTRAKRYKQVRRFLQWVGTELVRDTLGQDAWVNTQLPVIKDHLKNGRNVAVTNCRFENEARTIIDLGGTVVKVTRPGVGKVNNHSSDAGYAFKYASYEIMNDGSLLDLENKAHDLHLDILGAMLNDSMDAFNGAIKTGLANGVRMILDTTAPHSVDAVEWRKRHKLEGDITRDGIRVFVDNQEAGVVMYNDGVIEVNAKIAL